ncbi:unnamed protein product, partial [Chrysoparadoxa australica]
MEDDPLAAASTREAELLKGSGRAASSPLQVKRRMRQVMPLLPSPPQGSGGELMRIRGLDGVSRHLSRQASIGRRGPGPPTSLAAHPQTIAVGTANGLVLLFDQSQELTSVLSLPSDAVSSPGAARDPSRKSRAITMVVVDAVTSLDICGSGAYLISGHTSGKLALWDLSRGVLLKAVTDAHTSLITYIRCLHHSLPVVTSIDERGVVNRVTFRRVMWSAWVVDQDCLLDGAPGVIPAVAVLPTWQTLPKQQDKGSYAKANECIGGRAYTAPADGRGEMIAMSSKHTTFVVQMHPEIRVIHKWAAPSEVKMSESQSQEENTAGGWKGAVPCLSWGANEGNGKRRSTYLARGWGPQVEVLKAVLGSTPASSISWELVLTLSTLASVSASAAAALSVTAVEWLPNGLLGYLDSNLGLTVYDTIAKAQLTAVQLGEWGIARSSLVKRGCRACAGDGKLYVLTGDRMLVAQAQSWEQRVDGLVAAGEWLEGLVVALDHYEAEVKPVVSQKVVRRGSASDVLALSLDNSSITMNGRQRMERIKAQEALIRMSDLLIRYVKLAISNAPRSQLAGSAAAGSAPVGAMPGGPEASPLLATQAEGANSNAIDLSHNHFQMLAGVCVEFCVVTGLLDLLFGDIFARFVAAKHTYTLLDILEPYITLGRIKELSPGAVQHLADKCSTASEDEGVADARKQLEQVILKVDPAKMNVKFMIKIAREHELWSAYLVLSSSVLKDYITPLEQVLRRLMTAADEVDPPGQFPPDPSFCDLGYKALLYLRQSFMGEAFCQGATAARAVPNSSLPAVRAHLLYLLCQKVVSHDPMAVSYWRDSERSSYLWLAGSYPYLRILLYIDTKATLQVLSTVMDSPDTIFNDS